MNLDEANHWLKQENIRITLKQRGQSLFLVGTLPPKPGSKKTKPYQQEISLNAMKATPENILRAMVEARVVNDSVKLGRFDWNLYSPKVQAESTRTIRALIEQYTELHWQRNEKTIKREKVWKKEINHLYKLPLDTKPTVALFKSFGEQYDISSRTRKRVMIHLLNLAQLADFSSRDLKELRNLRATYHVSKTQRRTILTDKELLDLRISVEPGPVRFIIEALILWGLRPHELYLIDEMTPDCGGLIRIKEGGKSKSSRMVRPLYPEYFERWQTWKGTPPETIREDPGYVIAKVFRKLNLGLRPYDLRHSWAIRALYYPKITEEQAARSMGHSLGIHQSVYEHWISTKREREEFIAAQGLEATNSFIVLDDPEEPIEYKSYPFFSKHPLDSAFHKQPCPRCSSTSIVWVGWVKKNDEISGRRQRCNKCNKIMTIKKNPDLGQGSDDL
jgi:integrase